MKKGWAKALLSVMLVFVLVLSACSGNNGGNGGNTPSNGGGNTPNTPSNSGGSGNDAVNLSIMWWGPDSRHEATLAALDVYTKQNPNVTFTPDYMAWDGFWQKLPALAASRTVTDVLQMDAAYIQDYVAKGVLEDISDIDLSGVVDPGVIENLKIDGKLYGIPLSMNAQGIVFNKVELEAAGVSIPQKNWTWDQYWEFGYEVKSKMPEGKFGISDTATAWDWYNWYQTGNGAEPLFSDNGRKFHLDKELFDEYHNKLAQLRADKVVPPADVVLAFLENDPQADPMASGKVMTRGATTGSVAALEQLMPGQLDVVNLPVGVAGGGWAQSTIFLSVSANSTNKEQAKEFLKWFITDQEAGAALGLSRGMPISQEIFAELEPNLEPKDLLGKKLYDVSVEKALPFYPIAQGFTEWVDTYKATMEGVMFGQTTVDAAYEKLNKLGQDIAAANQ